MASRRVSAAFSALALVALLAAAAAAQQAAPVILHTSTEQIPLKTYAEFMRTGVMRIVSGSERDIPTVADVSYFRCSLTGWAPAPGQQQPLRPGSAKARLADALGTFELPAGDRAGQ